jgi:protein translocase SecG subunit
VHLFITIVQVILAIVLIVLMAIQTEKAQPGGVMGLGATGGRMSGAIDLPVGAERILKPLTRWVAGGFLGASVLAAVPNLQWWALLAGIALYVFLMMYGALIWQVTTGMRRTS